MGVTVEELDFAQASEDDRRGLFDVRAAWTAVPVVPYDAFAAACSARDELGFGPSRFAVAREAGQIVGYARAKVSEAEQNADLGLIIVVVRPEHRRQGIGTALLRAVPSLLNGRTIVESWGLTKGDEGERFATARGFRIVTSMTTQRLALAALPEVAELPSGYELATWRGTVPEEFVEAYVKGLNAVADAPFGETALDHAFNTVESVRQDTADRWVVLLLHEGEAAGVTVVELDPAVPAVATQLHTAVLPAHRGKGLGRLIKARMLHNLTGVEEIYTRTSSENEHMLRVNHSLGYTDIDTYVAVQAQVADLRHRLVS
ncbi:GNAT family N-acetyltransferase [Lentzea sp. NPDC004789]